MPADVLTLAAAVGGAVKTWRQALERPQECRADDVAVAMHDYLGLEWTRSSVATFENGARDLTAGELAVLPIALSLAAGRQVSLDELFDLIDPETRVRLVGEFTIPFRVARHLLAGRGVAIDERSLPGIGKGSSGSAAHVSVKPAPVTARGAVPAPVVQVGPRKADTAAELERRTARRLGLAPEEVAEVAVRLFGRTLTAERDRRVDEQLPADAPPRTVQAVRGHVSRQLLTKLRAAVNEGASNGGRDGTRPDAGER